MLFSGCDGEETSSDSDALPMDRSQLEKYVQEQLENKDEFGQISSVSCDADLSNDDDAATRCLLSLANGFEQPVQVTTLEDNSGHLAPALSYVVKTSGWGSSQ